MVSPEPPSPADPVETNVLAVDPDSVSPVAICIDPVISLERPVEVSIIISPPLPVFNPTPLFEPALTNTEPPFNSFDTDLPACKRIEEACVLMLLPVDITKVPELDKADPAV